MGNMVDEWLAVLPHTGNFLIPTDFLCGICLFTFAVSTHIQKCACLV